MTVSVLIVTYNHEKFIAQAVESALMQITNFDYEIVIGEDCSTDKTREIVLAYKAKSPDNIKLLLQERNVGMMPNFIATLKSCTGKYIALLEGDDYWTDPYKLQKQVDFLEANPEYGLIHTNGRVLNENNGKEIISINHTKKLLLEDENNFSKNLLIGNVNVLTFSTLFRKNILVNEVDYLNSNWNGYLMGDTKLWLDLALHSKVKYFDECTGVYRIWGGSASRTKSFEKSWNFINSSYKLRLDYAKRLNLPQSDIDKIQVSMNRILLNIAAIHNKPHLVKDSFEIIKSLGGVTSKDKIFFYAYKNKLFYYLLRVLILIKRTFQK